MNFIILADRSHRGMKSKGCPALYKKGYGNLFDYQYKIIKKNFKRSKIIYLYGFDDKKMCQYIKSNRIENKYNDVTFVYNKKHAEYNYVHSLNMVNEFMDKDFFIMFGDTVPSSFLFKNFSKNYGTQIYINQKAKSNIGCIINENGHINNLCFDLDNYLMNIYYISKQDAPIMQELCTYTEYRNYFIFEILNQMISLGIKISPFFRNKTPITIKQQKAKS